MYEQDKAIFAAKIWAQALRKNESTQDEANVLEKLIEMADHKVKTPFGNLRVKEEDLTSTSASTSIDIILEQKEEAETIASIYYDRTLDAIYISTTKDSDGLQKEDVLAFNKKAFENQKAAILRRKLANVNWG